MDGISLGKLKTQINANEAASPWNTGFIKNCATLECEGGCQVQLPLPDTLCWCPVPGIRVTAGLPSESTVLRGRQRREKSAMYTEY